MFHTHVDFHAFVSWAQVLNLDILRSFGTAILLVLIISINFDSSVGLFPDSPSANAREEIIKKNPTHRDQPEKRVLVILPRISAGTSSNGAERKSPSGNQAGAVGCGGAATPTEQRCPSRAGTAD
jgi:hypothetical protein